MISLRILYVTAVCTVMFHCTEPTPERTEKKKVELEEASLVDSLKIIEFYKGKIPCNDCSDRQAQLWLMRKELDDSVGLFLLRETTWGEPGHEQVINTRGKWLRYMETIEAGHGVIVELSEDSITGFSRRTFLLQRSGLKEQGRKDVWLERKI